MKAAVGAPPFWFRATAVGTCWLGAWATTPGKLVKKVLATVPSPSPAKAEPTPSESTAAAASIMVFMVILLGLLPLSRGSLDLGQSLRGRSAVLSRIAMADK